MYVDLELIYPEDQISHGEMSFEELRAKARGWYGRQWDNTSSSPRLESINNSEIAISGPVSVAAAETNPPRLSMKAGVQETQSSPGVPSEDTTAPDVSREEKDARMRRTRVKEVKGETQTSKDFHTSRLAPC